ncbi:MAG: hypothetical protein ACPGQL_03970 [Thermoplasmatota archaeon]
MALVVHDFRVYHELVPFLEEHDLPVLALAPGDHIPPSVKVLLDGPPADDRSVKLPIGDPEETLVATRAALLGHPPGAPPFRRAVIGVDPGDVIGLAVLADDQVLVIGEEREPAAVAARVRSWCSVLAASAWAVHIGDGARRVANAVLDQLAFELPDAEVVLVPEHATTPYAVATKSRHTDAAIRIALREPVAGTGP